MEFAKDIDGDAAEKLCPGVGIRWGISMPFACHFFLGRAVPIGKGPDISTPNPANNP